MVLIDTGIYQVKQFLDTLSGELRTIMNIQEEKIFVDQITQRTENRNILETGSSSRQSEESKEEVSNRINTIKEKEPAGLGWWWLAIIGTVIVLILALCLLVRRYFPKR